MVKCTALKMKLGGCSGGDPWVIHPFSAFRHYYTMFMVFMTFVNLLSVPLDVAFSEDTKEFAHLAWLGFNVFLDILCMTDVFLNFRMGILSEDGEEAILDLKEIRREYLKTWFAADFICAIPIDLIGLFLDVHTYSDTVAAGKIIRIFTFVRILSMIRLLRLSKIVRFFVELDQVSNLNLAWLRSSVRKVRLYVLLCLLLHWNTCIQYFVSKATDFPSDCWVVQENLMNARVWKIYSYGMLRAVSQTFGLAYGTGTGGPPTDSMELWAAMISRICGALMFILLVVDAVYAASQNNTPEKEYKNKVNRLEAYMAFSKLPKDLRSRIRDYYQVRYGGRWFDEESILGMVPRNVKKEIQAARCAGLLQKVFIFQNCSAGFINALLPHLQYEVCLEGDIIIHPDAPPTRTFFIDLGRVLEERESVKTKLSDGGYFGDMSWLTGGSHLATVRALSDCHLYSISAETFRTVLQDFPEVVSGLEKAVERHRGGLSGCETSAVEVAQ